MDAREERGLVIATKSRIEKNRLGWKVPSQSGNRIYIMGIDKMSKWVYTNVYKHD